MSNQEKRGTSRPSVLFPLLVFAVALSILLLTADREALLSAIRRFRPEYIPLILGLSLLNYLLRFGRFDFYLRRIGIRVGHLTSATVFASGLAMTVTPGKAGELIKAYGLNRAAGTPAERIIPVIVMERINDAVGVVLLAALGAASGSLRPFLVVTAILVLVHGLLLAKKTTKSILSRILPRGRRALLREKIVIALDSLEVLARPGPLLVATSLSLLAWGAEGLGLVLVVRSLGASLPAGPIVMAYAVATLAGALSFIPGGLLVTEGSLTAILVTLGLVRATAALATTICRIATLWFAVAIGCLTLFVFWPRVIRSAP